MEADGLTILPHSIDRARSYFRRLHQRVLSPDNSGRVILVTHLLPDRPPFLEALSKSCRIVGIIPKRKSIYGPAKSNIENSYPILDVTREQLADPARAVTIFEECSQGERTVILDIGGYFASALNALHKSCPDALVGIVEDTENGLQRYERLPHLPVPVFTVACSPLKEPEDHLTGESVVFSAERLIRACGEVVCGRRVAVFGYGKVGRSIARVLHSRGVRVSVIDTNPIRAVEAAAHGFRILEKKMALASCELLFGATGNFSLSGDDFHYVRNGSFIASVTSSDDELELRDLPDRYEQRLVHDSVVCYYREGHYFYLMNEGNAVNFIDGAVLGPFIYLTQGELLAALHLMQNVKEQPPGIQAVNSNTRQHIAKIWLEVFNDNRIIIPGTL